MRNRWCLAFVVAVLTSVLAIDAEARPGGAGRRGGGPRPGGNRIGNVAPNTIRPGQLGQGIGGAGNKLQNLGGGNFANSLKNTVQNGNPQNKVSQLKTNFTPDNQPFSPAWYADHPNAWQYTHPHADAWAVATIGTAAAWLGIAATADAYPATAESVYTSEATESEQPADEQANQDAQQQNSQQQPAAAGDYLPLGVFALAPPSEKDASALVQLAVNKQGEVRGNYYDVLTGKDQPIAGTIDKQTQRARFQAGTGDVTFETTLANLTQPVGSVTLRFQNGQSRQWKLARFDEQSARSQ